MRTACFCACLGLLLGCGATPHDAGDGASGAGGSQTTGGTASGGASGVGPSSAGTSSGGSSGGLSSGGTSAGGAAGGSRASGGAGGSIVGSGGTAPHVVVDCNSAAVGVWEDITPPDIVANSRYQTDGYGVGAFVIDPKNTANVTLGSDRFGVHRTTDCGATWNKANTGVGASDIDSGSQWSMAIDPVDPNIIYTVAGYGTMGVFKTTNAGRDWAQTLAPEYAKIFIYGGFTAQVRVDPTDHEHLLITPHFTCENGHSSSCFLQTQDGGTSWTAIENVPGGGEGLRLLMVDHDTWFIGAGGLHRTSNGGRDWAQVTPANSYAYEVSHRAGGKYYLPTAFGISESSDGITWSALSNAPGAFIVTTSKTRIYAEGGNFCVFKHDTPFNPISSAPIDDPTNWTVDTHYSNYYGAGDLQYDDDHHMLYASSCMGGFWRVRTE